MERQDEIAENFSHHCSLLQTIRNEGKSRIMTTASGLHDVRGIGVLFPALRRRSSVIFEVFTAVTMKNAVFWDIKTQFILHRRHITSPLQSSTS
jgi:hypothetical protein